jgi:hypothetical protein
MLQALQGSLRLALCQPLFQKVRAGNRVENQTTAPPQDPPTPLNQTPLNQTPLEKLIGLVADVWRKERPYRQPASLPLGMLELARNTIVSYRNPLDLERLQLCVYIVDELATAYNAGSRRDPRYTRVFVGISTALRPIYEHATRPGASPDPVWSEKLNATLKNTSSVGEKLNATLKNTSSVGGVETDATQVLPDSAMSPLKEWVMRIRGRAATLGVGDNV